MMGLCDLHGEISSSREISIQLKSTSIQADYLTLTKIKPQVNTVKITQQRIVPSTPPRQRNPELSEDQMVIAVFDTEGKEITRIFLIDPRLIRAESEDRNGRLTTQIFYREEVDFTIAVPDRSDLGELKIFQPHWTGSEFLMELIGETQLELRSN